MVCVVVVLMFHYWRPFKLLGLKHSAGRRSCQSHYCMGTRMLYISSLNRPSIPSRAPLYSRLAVQPGPRDEMTSLGSRPVPATDLLGAGSGEFEEGAERLRVVVGVEVLI